MIALLNSMLMTMKFTKRFDVELADTVSERGRDYGPPAVDFARAAALKAVVAECNDPVMRHALDMICVKIARLINHPSHFDSIKDIAGYCRTMTMVMDDRIEKLIQEDENE